jgi:uncharacterized damage-inducible protein DinB
MGSYNSAGEALMLNESLIAEAKREGATTRRVLERIPEDKLTWKPHPKSTDLGTLGLHIASVQGFFAEFLSEPTREAPAFTPPSPSSVGQILEAHDRSVAATVAKLSGWSDDDLRAEWTLTRQGATLFSLPRGVAVRTLMLNHIYHHRGQLTVYLRLLGVPVPSVYGPSADERPFG